MGSANANQKTDERLAAGGATEQQSSASSAASASGKPSAIGKGGQAPSKPGAEADKQPHRATTDAEIGDGDGLKGEYYLGRNFDQYQFTRADPNVDFVWATDTNPSPNPRLPQGSDYSARWTGKIQPRFSETYTIYGVADDGVRVWVDHKLLIDA